MQPINITDPAWRTTFPKLVAPLPNEWLPGLLLRCDEVNNWESMTTLTLLQQLSPNKIEWGKRMERIIYFPPHLLKLDILAQLLAIPTGAILGTTYYYERVQLYRARSTPERLNPPFLFRLCPECLAESRLLRRSVLLPHITLCPQHQFTLLNTCRCGSSLHLFHRQSQPFTCYVCGVYWADLPRIVASPERVALEHEILLWYEFFFSKGTLLSFSQMEKLYSKTPSESKINLLQTKSVLMSYDCHELLLLGMIASALVERNHSPSDLVSYEELIASHLG